MISLESSGPTFFQNVRSNFSIAPTDRGVENFFDRTFSLPLAFLGNLSFKALTLVARHLRP